MIDFLTFKSFIGIEVLIIIYYSGALIMPIAILYLLKRGEFFSIFNSIKIRNKWYFGIAFLLCFLVCEIFWRVGFEAIIGYFQMVEATKGGV